MNRIGFLNIILVGYALFFLLKFPPVLPYVYFCLGLFFGYLFHLIDRIFQVFLIPELRVQKEQFISSLKKMQLIFGFTELVQSVPSASASFIFILLYFPLALYVVSSTGSILGTGIVLGLGLSYVTRFILGSNQIQDLRSIYFKQLSSTISDRDVKRLTGVFIGLFVVLSLYVLL